MKFVRTHWFIFLLAITILIIFIFELLLNAAHKKNSKNTPVVNREVVSFKE
jgi:hypothetical protein